MFRTDSIGRILWSEELLEAVGPIAPAIVSKKVTNNGTLSSSVEITLQKGTTFITVQALAKDVYLKWGTDDVTSSNMDEIITAGTVRNFLVPEGITALNVIESAASATVIIIEK